MKVTALKQEEVHLISDLRPDGWNNIIPFFENYIQASFCYPIKICIDNTIVGLGATIIHQETAWLAHIIVHPKFRNQGIGKSITRALIDLSYEKNCETICLIATELGAIIYNKLGFITETNYSFYKELNQQEPWLISKYISPFHPTYREQLLAMDLLVTKENRLASLESVIEQGLLYIENGTLKGYYLPTFGEGLIIAVEEQAGIELMKLRLNSSKDVSFPVDNLAATQFMAEANYSPFKTAKRMRIGKPKTVIFSSIFNRIGGHLG